ncbi:hypothetical protein WR25_12973 [Diploscapter pachys]|uniref:PEP-utilising enzyme mobile domain-containing protein n=1 Tax=Diploscapter pachys TaxID=2018661 RepID=A0A2A2KFA5_9BILA|nr:hypothetical protein WR25_12973 [Diploscapter pachys]
MAAGGATSHVAILARARGLPCLVAVGEALLELPAGTPLVLDADQGRLETEADAQRLAEVQRHVQQRHETRQRQRAAAQQSARTRDGQQLDYLPLPAEANPVLGLRGIRLGQVRPELLDQQLRALLQSTS